MANLIKAGSKRRRTQAEIKADKEEALIKHQSIKEKLVKYAELSENVADYERMQ